MARRSSARIAWCAVVIVAYAALGIVAYRIGPVRSSVKCEILGSGSARTAHSSAPTAHDDVSSFLLFVDAPPPRGIVKFRETGPTPSVQLLDPHVSTVACSNNAEAGTVAGRADVPSPAPHEVGFRIHLQEPERRGPPSIRLQLTNGYDSGSQAFTHGSLTINQSGESRTAQAP